MSCFPFDILEILICIFFNLASISVASSHFSVQTSLFEEIVPLSVPFSIGENNLSHNVVFHRVCGHRISSLTTSRLLFGLGFLFVCITRNTVFILGSEKANFRLGFCTNT